MVLWKWYIVVYKDAMEIEFSDNTMKYYREQELPIVYKGRKLKRAFFADFILFDNIIVEVKANADGISEDAIAQTLNYLKASGNRLAYGQLTGNGSGCSQLVFSLMYLPLTDDSWKACIISNTWLAMAPLARNFLPRLRRNA